MLLRDRGGYSGPRHDRALGADRRPLLRAQASCELVDLVLGAGDSERELCREQMSMLPRSCTARSASLSATFRGCSARIPRGPSCRSVTTSVRVSVAFASRSAAASTCCCSAVKRRSVWRPLFGLVVPSDSHARSRGSRSVASTLIDRVRARRQRRLSAATQQASLPSCDYHNVVRDASLELLDDVWAAGARSAHSTDRPPPARRGSAWSPKS